MNNERKLLADVIRRDRFTTKEDILEWIDESRRRIQIVSKTDKKHSAAFYHIYDGLLEEFYTKVVKTVLFDHLEDFWHYAINVSDSGAILNLDYNDHAVMGKDGSVGLRGNSQRFRLLETRPRYLSIEEYANNYSVSVITVRQWIRRGKIRNAIKIGREWIIPELTELPGRGYKSCFYTWRGKLSNMPEGYEFLNDYNIAIFNQDCTDKNLFHIQFVAGGTSRMMTKDVDTKEREKIELYMISNPSVKYDGGPEDGLNVEITTKNHFGFEIEE